MVETARPVGFVSGVKALYVSATLFAFVSLSVKLAAPYYGALFVSAIRFAIGAVLALSVVLLKYRDQKPRHWGLLVARGLLGTVAMVMTYAAIDRTGPGRATVLANTYPLFVAVFAALFFGEKFRKATAASLACCLVGAVLVANDGSAPSGAPAAARILSGDLLALGSAVLAGMAVNIVRRLSAHENPFTIYLFPCLFGLPLLFFAAPEAGAARAGILGPLLLLLLGVGAFAAQALMAYGYRTVEAGKGSVVFYWETALTVLLGGLVAGETFTARFFLGLAVIMVGLRINQGIGAR